MSDDTNTAPETGEDTQAAQDDLFVGADVYAWRAIDEQAVCASWMGRHMEALTLSRRMLATPGIPDHDRKRIAANRDISARQLLDASRAASMHAAPMASGPG